MVAIQGIRVQDVLLTDFYLKFLGKTVDDKIKQMLFLCLTVCLGRLHTASKQTLVVNYPTLLALTRSLRVGLPASKTHFAGTGVVPVGSAVSTGVPSE